MKRLNKKGISLYELLATISLSGVVLALLSFIFVQSLFNISHSKMNSEMIRDVSLMFENIREMIDESKSTYINHDNNSITLQNGSKISYDKDFLNLSSSNLNFTYPLNKEHDYQITFKESENVKDLFEITVQINANNQGKTITKTYKTSYIIKSA